MRAGSWVPGQRAHGTLRRTGPRRGPAMAAVATPAHPWPSGGNSATPEWTSRWQSARAPRGQGRTLF